MSGNERTLLVSSWVKTLVKYSFRIIAFSWLDIASSLSLVLKVSAGNLIFSLELTYFGIVFYIINQTFFIVTFNQTV